MNRCLFPLAAAVLLVAGCASDAGLTAAKDVSPMAPHADAGLSLASQESRAEAPKPAQIALKKREVIRTATLAIRVNDLEADEKRVNAVVAELGGYVANVSSTDLAGAGASISISLRIPVQRFDEAIARFEAMGTRLSKTIAAEDVTSQAVDLDARLKTMRAQEDAVRQMMKGLRDMNQILDLQNRLAGLRGEIESIQAQRSKLAEQAALSTITVELHQSAAKLAASPSTDAHWFAHSQGQAAGAAMTAFKAVVSLCLWIVYFSPIWIAFVLLAWWVSRASKKSAKEQAMPSAPVS